MKRLMLLALFALTLLAGTLPGAAFAAASAGAHVVNDTVIHYEGDGSARHLSVKGVSTETITPEGNTIYTANMKSTQALYDPNGTLVFTSDSKQHQLRLIAEPVSGDVEQPYHIVSDRFATTITLPDGSTCSTIYRLHMVEGVIKLFDVTFPCAQ